jgi:recombination protein RecR
MNYSSQLLEKAVTEINRLPGIGSKTALRLALHLLRQDEGKVDALANSIVKMRREVRYCNTCYNICDGECCEICSNPLRDKSIVCVVENIQDVMAIENTMQYRGLYHVLGGVISPMDGIGPSDLQIESLVERVRQGGVAEVILALSPTMEGDTTNYYIFRKLEETGVRVTVIARGVAQNDELQYTDEVTLGRALAGRIPFNNS